MYYYYVQIKANSVKTNAMTNAVSRAMTSTKTSTMTIAQLMGAVFSSPNEKVPGLTMSVISVNFLLKQHTLRTTPKFFKIIALMTLLTIGRRSQNSCQQQDVFNALCGLGMVTLDDISEHSVCGCKEACMCQKYTNLLRELQKQLDKRDFWGCTMVSGWLWFIENFVNDRCPQLLDILKTALMEGLTEFRDAWFMQNYCRYFTTKKSIADLTSIMQMFENIIDKFYRKCPWNYDISLNGITCTGCPGCWCCTDLARLFKIEISIRLEHMKTVINGMISASTIDSERNKLQRLKTKMFGFQVIMMTSYGTRHDDSNLNIFNQLFIPALNNSLIVSKSILALTQFTQVAFIKRLLDQASDANLHIRCDDTRYALFALLMVVTLFTKDEEEQEEARSALEKYFQNTTEPTLGAVYDALSVISRERRLMCTLLVDFVHVVMTAPGTPIDGLSRRVAYDKIQQSYEMYIMPHIFTANSSAEELMAMYAELVSPYVMSGKSCLPYKHVFLHMFYVLEIQKKEGMTEALHTLLDAVRDTCIAHGWGV